MDQPQKTIELHIPQRKPSDRIAIGGKYIFGNYIKPSFLAWPTKVLYPSTRIESSNQLNSKPSSLCFSFRKIGHLSYMWKLRFGMKHYNLKWVPMVLCLMASSTISKDHVSGMYVVVVLDI